MKALKYFTIAAACFLSMACQKTEWDVITPNGIEIQKARGIDHMRIVTAGDGEPFGLGTCGDDDVVGGVTVASTCSNLMILKPGLFADEGNIRVREDGFDTSTELGHDSGHTFASLSEGGAVDIGLRGDAAHIEAGAAHVVALEDDNLQTLLGGIFSGAVTPRPRADDD